MEYGLIGEHLGHSFSPIIHGKIADYPYELKEIAPNELDLFMKQKDFKGINVTVRIYNYTNYIITLFRRIVKCFL